MGCSPAPIDGILCNRNRYVIVPGSDTELGCQGCEPATRCMSHRHFTPGKLSAKCEDELPMIDKSSSNEPKQIILAAIFRKEPYKWALGRVVHSLPHLTSASKIFETGSSNWYQPLMSTNRPGAFVRQTGVTRADLSFPKSSNTGRMSFYAWRGLTVPVLVST